MSVQFGRWNLDGRPVDAAYLWKVRGMLAPYGPDGEETYIKDSVAVLYRPFYTTKESRREIQPVLLASGEVLTWDGRLDNREDLVSSLRDRLSIESTDAAIVAAAYGRRGTDCFATLIGDWALAIWNPRDRSVILAKDFLGARQLYYTFDKHEFIWSSTLDPIVQLTEKPLALEGEYIAGWFSLFPASTLTPFMGIRSVPPACFIRFQNGNETIARHWDFDPEKRVRYATDVEYEEHFRSAFTVSVERCLRSDSPIPAELSGGMDSSCIVCMADSILAKKTGCTSRLDTLSYYNDSETNWNERPYFTIVENKRGRRGCHIDVSFEESLQLEYAGDTFAATPGSPNGRSTKAQQQFSECLCSRRNRVVLSGTGGDEIVGGVPTPIPELMDLLARGHFRSLAHQLSLWALHSREPWFHLLFEATREFLPPILVGVPKRLRPVAWLHPEFVKRHGAALSGYSTRVKLFGPAPSFQDCLSTLDALRRQLACTPRPCSPPYEKRFPYLDRDLLEFLYAIPREQIVRPGRRRSLMRRAMLGIVPDEILNRKRKGFVARGPTLRLANERAALVELSTSMVSASLGFIDAGAFREVIERAGHGEQIHIVAMLRTLAMESWLRTLKIRGILTAGVPGMHTGPQPRGDKPSNAMCTLKKRIACVLLVQTNARRERR